MLDTSLSLNLSDPAMCANVSFGFEWNGRKNSLLFLFAAVTLDNRPIVLELLLA